MAGDVDPIALTRVASHENFVKIYETFDEFEADIASILYATCRITSFKVTKFYSAFLPFHCFLHELTRVEEVSDSCPDFENFAISRSRSRPKLHSCAESLSLVSLGIKSRCGSRKSRCGSRKSRCGSPKSGPTKNRSQMRGLRLAKSGHRVAKAWSYILQNFENFWFLWIWIQAFATKLWRD